MLARMMEQGAAIIAERRTKAPAGLFAPVEQQVQTPAKRRFEAPAEKRAEPPW